MNVTFEKSSSELIYSLKEKEYRFTIDNKHLINKIQFLTNDINELSNVYPDFDDFFNELFEVLTTGEYTNEHFNKALDYSTKFIEIKNVDISKLSDINKKTKNSIFFDEDEVKDLIKVIGLLKIFAPFMYDKRYIEYTTPIVDHLDKSYKNILSKLYKIIKTKAKASDYKQILNLWKLDISLDYISLYNFEFILLTALVFYNWSINPLSFIVSVASDLTNFWIMTLKAYPYSYSDDISENNMEDFLDVISYEIMLDQVDASIDRLLDTNSYNVNYNLFLTQFNQVIVLPLMSMISDIDIDYLEQRSKQDKINYQIMMYYIINNKSEYIKSLMGNSLKLFLYGYSRPVSTSSILSPSILEVLKMQISYYQMNSKIPLLDLAQELGTLMVRNRVLENYITSSIFVNSYDMIDRTGRDMIKFMTNMFDDKIVENIKAEGKSIFIDFISNVTLTKDYTKKFM